MPVCMICMIDFSGCTAVEVTVMHVVCSPFLRLLVYLYDWENRFLQLPLSGGQSILRLVLPCFSSMLVNVRLGKSISPVAIEWRSVSFAAVCSPFCGMLVDVRLRTSVFLGCRLSGGQFPLWLSDLSSVAC